VVGERGSDSLDHEEWARGVVRAAHVDLRHSAGRELAEEVVASETADRR
jgi:hypothetical protein